MKVVPVDDLFIALTGEEKEELLSHVAEVYQRVTGNVHTWQQPQKEYDL